MVPEQIPEEHWRVFQKAKKNSRNMDLRFSVG
jgi:hypothetical protein